MRRRLRGLFFHGVFFLLLLFLAFFPTYLHSLRTPTGTTYSMWHGEYPDYYGYLSVIRQGRTQFHFTATYTTDDKPTQYIHLFYLILGRIGAWGGVSDAMMYFAGIAFSLLVFFTFSVLLVRELLPRSLRSLTLVLIFFASPFPNGTLPFVSLPIGTGGWTKTDISSRVFHVPHHFIALSLSLFCVYSLFRFFRTGRLVFALLCAFSLGLSLVFFAVPGFVFLLSFTGALTFFAFFHSLRTHASQKIPESRHQTVSSFRVRFLPGCFLILFFGISALFFSSRQIDTAGFASIEYSSFRPERYPYVFSVFLSSYGPFLFLLPFGLLVQRTRLRFPAVLLLFLSIAPLPLYVSSVVGILPITKIRFMYSATYVFAGLFSGLGIATFLSSVKDTKRRGAVVWGIALIVFLNAGVGVFSYWVPKLTPMPAYQNVYIPDTYLRVASFLSDATPPFSSLLARYDVASFLPAFSNTRVFAGHPLAFSERPEKKKLLDSFFSGAMPREDVSDFFRTYHLSYVLWEKPDVPAHFAPFLLPVFQTENLRLFRVISL